MVVSDDRGTIRAGFAMRRQQYGRVDFEPDGSILRYVRSRAYVRNVREVAEQQTANLVLRFGARQAYDPVIKRP
ncbi:hypothetical protein Sbs19_34170 [Sphingobium sp. BS19]|nr:hypothetical protein Sbs19_34170 [Sphingobium sp. BS19]